MVFVPESNDFIYRDTGIGMTRQELVDCLGTIAQSGTAKFLKALKVQDSFQPLLFLVILTFYDLYLLTF